MFSADPKPSQEVYVVSTVPVGSVHRDETSALLDCYRRNYAILKEEVKQSRDTTNAHRSQQYVLLKTILGMLPEPGVLQGADKQDILRELQHIYGALHNERTYDTYSAEVEGDPS